MSYRNRFAILIEVAQALSYAHSKGVYHRDLKPGNIRALETGTQLMDFGIAKMSTSHTPLTKAGTLLGTAGYVAPEQVLGRPVDHRVDIFAFGALAHELFTYRRPFTGPTVRERLNSVLEVDPGPIRAFWSDRPSGLDSAIARRLAKDPSARYSTFGEVINDLSRVQADLEDAEEAPTAMFHDEPPPIDPPAEAADAGAMTPVAAVAAPPGDAPTLAAVPTTPAPAPPDPPRLPAPAPKPDASPDATLIAPLAAPGLPSGSCAIGAPHRSGARAFASYRGDAGRCSGFRGRAHSGRGCELGGPGECRSPDRSRGGSDPGDRWWPRDTAAARTAVARTDAVVPPPPAVVAQPPKAEGSAIAAAQPPRGAPVRRWWLIGAIALAVGLGIAVVLWTMLRSSSGDRRTEPEQASVEPVALGAAAPELELAAAASGRVVVDATPWGELVAVIASDGKRVDTPQQASTPLVLTLAPGEYEVQIARPGDGQEPRSCRVTVAASALERCRVELGRVTARHYFKESGWWQ